MFSSLYSSTSTSSHQSYFVLHFRILIQIVKHSFRCLPLHFLLVVVPDVWFLIWHHLPVLLTQYLLLQEIVPNIHTWYHPCNCSPKPPCWPHHCYLPYLLLNTLLIISFLFIIHRHPLMPFNNPAYTWHTQNRYWFSVEETNSQKHFCGTFQYPFHVPRNIDHKGSISSNFQFKWP